MKKLAVLNCFDDLNNFIESMQLKYEELHEWSFVFVTGTNADVLKPSVRAIFLKDKIGFIPPFMPLKSYCVFQVLREEIPDLVVFQGSSALAFFSLLDRKQNDLLQKTIFLLVRPSSLAFEAEQGEKFLAGRTDIELNAMEEYSVGLFDKIIITNGLEKFLDWMERTNWVPPEVIDFRCGKIDVSNLSTLSVYNNKQEADVPFISVCLTTFNRTELLAQALKSLSLQSCENFEVIVVDDGSDAKFQTQWDDIQIQYSDKGWFFYSQENLGPAIARNFAASVAKGSHLLFMDDDNWALANEIEFFVNAVVNSDADIFTCIPGWHPESSFKSELNLCLSINDPCFREVKPDWIPLGGFIDLGVFINCFGDTNALIKKDVFFALDGFATEKELLLEDVDFFTRAVAANYRLEVIPHILFLYRKHKNSRSWNKYIYQSHVRSLQPYKKIVDERLWSIIFSQRKGFYDRHAAIASQARERGNVTTGEWIDFKCNDFVFLVDNPGKRHCLLIDATGSGVINFDINDRKYSLEIKTETFSIFQCALLPDVIQSSGEISIKFNIPDNILLRRYSLMRETF